MSYIERGYFIVPKTYEESNEKIKNKKAVVVNAEEFIEIVEKRGLKEAAKEVDVVTTAAIGPTLAILAPSAINLTIFGASFFTL